MPLGFVAILAAVIRMKQQVFIIEIIAFFFKRINQLCSCNSDQFKVDEEIESLGNTDNIFTLHSIVVAKLISHSNSAPFRRTKMDFKCTEKEVEERCKEEDEEEYIDDQYIVTVKQEWGE